MERLTSDKQGWSISTSEIGDIVCVRLDSDDGLILTKGYTSRRKFIVIVGFTPEGIALGTLLINSKVSPIKQTPELLNSQYPLLARNYRSFLKYDSWLDCSDIFELSKDKIEERDGYHIGKLIEDDKERVLTYLKESDLIDTFTKQRFGLL